MKRKGVEIIQRNGLILAIMSREQLPISLGQLAIECEFRLPEICNRLEVSERHLRRVFTDGIGMGPKEWLRQQRMVAARKMLRDGSSVKEVSIDLGYASPKMLSRDFIEFHGVRPTEFQQQEAQYVLRAII